MRKLLLLLGTALILNGCSTLKPSYRYTPYDFQCDCGRWDFRYYNNWWVRPWTYVKPTKPQVNIPKRGRSNQLRPQTRRITSNNKLKRNQ